MGLTDKFVVADHGSKASDGIGCHARIMLPSPQKQLAAGSGQRAAALIIQLPICAMSGQRPLAGNDLDLPSI
jgi:hypothetical protein